MESCLWTISSANSRLLMELQKARIKSIGAFLRLSGTAAGLILPAASIPR